MKPLVTTGCANVSYKLISKIITRRLQPMMSGFINEEQFVFFHKRQIHDVVSLAQETLHSLKKNNLKFVILKLDLPKAYDRVNWNVLRLVIL